MNRKSYSQILDQVARDRLDANTNLTPRILAQIQKGKGATMQPRMKVFATAFVVLLVFMIVLVSVPSVRAAIQRWIGYVPGMGLVNEGQIRMLEEPVSVTRDGITLTVKEMWVASDQTVIQYAVEGWTREVPHTELLDGTCNEDPILSLPDRELTLAKPQATLGWDTGYEFKSIYPAIPAAVNDVTFVMPCVVLALPGEAPENWELSLHLIPAPPNTVFPVIEISTLAESQATATGLPPTEPSINRTGEGIFLVLDRAVQMDDGYLIYMTIHYENTGLEWIDTPDPTTLHLLDSSRQAISYELDWEATTSVETTASPGQTAFAIKTAPIQIPGPLTLVLASVSANMAADASFTFDPGPNPTPGQVWELNQDLDVGHGHSLQVLRVTYDLTDGVQAYLSFEMESKTGITYAFLFDEAHPLTGTGGGGGGASTPGPFTSDLYYLEPLPQGPLTVNITGVSFLLPGSWHAEWTPPGP